MKFLRLPFPGTTLAAVAVLLFCCSAPAQTLDQKPARKPYKPATAPTSAQQDFDVLVFTNGDSLKGKFLHAVGGNLVFHSNMLGNISVPWSKVKELRTASQLAVLPGSIAVRHGKVSGKVPIGTLTLANSTITVHQPSPAPPVNIPVQHARFVLDENTLEKELRNHPGIFQAWNGSITGGANIVQATQQEYTFSGGIAMQRVSPTVSWLNTRVRTTFDLSGSYGKITQPGYTRTSGTPPVTTYVPSTETKSAIYHADAEQDNYFSPRFFALVQGSLDHNFAQNLELQQSYGGGVGWTAVKLPAQEFDLKIALQYQGQRFIKASPGQNRSLAGSNLALVYQLKLPHNMHFIQNAAYNPAFNTPHAYSANETNTVTIPFFKNLSFSMGTIDSYLNAPPSSLPPTRRNSFQLTTGVSYTIKSRY
ncbi:MAG: DUF481 domain-containing protein [Acidobacteriaceae bacterium]